LKNEVLYTWLWLLIAELQNPKKRSNLLQMLLVSKCSNQILYVWTRFFKENLEIKFIFYEKIIKKTFVNFLSGNNRNFGSFQWSLKNLDVTAKVGPDRPNFAKNIWTHTDISSRNSILRILTVLRMTNIHLRRSLRDITIWRNKKWDLNGPSRFLSVPTLNPNLVFKIFISHRDRPAYGDMIIKSLFSSPSAEPPAWFFYLFLQLFVSSILLLFSYFFCFSYNFFISSFFKIWV